MVHNFYIFDLYILFSIDSFYDLFLINSYMYSREWMKIFSKKLILPNKGIPNKEYNTQDKE